jgi:hypothetical protein
LREFPARAARLLNAARLPLAIAALLTLLYLLISFTLLRAPGLSGRAGRVINPAAVRADWLYRPAAGVEVLVMWNSRPLPGTVPPRCLRAVLVRTNLDGDFRVKWWLVPWSWPFEGAGQPVAVLLPARFVTSSEGTHPAEAFSHLLTPAIAAGPRDAQRIARDAGCGTLELPAAQR